MSKHHFNTALLLFIAGMGGFLYGYDIGIIGAALLYLGKTVSLSLQQESWIVAAVLGGSMISSLVAGLLADFIGRKKVMLASAFLFVLSVVLIVLAEGFLPLFLGRGLQGLSAGMIAVVIPLYLAETLPAHIRGRGTAVFQLLLTVGILVSLAVGAHYTASVDHITSSGASAAALLLAQTEAWRAMFKSAMFPGLIFLVGSFMVAESPRWLFRHGRRDQALLSLQKTRAPEQAQLEFAAMHYVAEHESVHGQSSQRESLLQRKYIIPFLLTCAVLGLNQTTGINSILQFLVVILQQAGLDASSAAEKATWVTAVNVVFTIVGLLLVDKLGRKALFKIGTAGITIALLISAFVFYRFEAGRTDLTTQVASRVSGSTLSLRLDSSLLPELGSKGPVQMSVLYSYAGQEKIATVFSNGSNPVLEIHPDAASTGTPLLIKRARLGPIPTASSGNIVMICLMLFIAAFATGPGVCVWLALSELMPTRIRSFGMGLGLLINQGVSTAIAAIFLPFVGNFGYSLMFLFWALCTAIYFAISAWLLPETKGRTLEEIESHFARPKP